MRSMQHTSRGAEERRADRTKASTTTTAQQVRERERASRSEHRSKYLGLSDRDVVRELAQSR